MKATKRILAWLLTVWILMSMATVFASAAESEAHTCVDVAPKDLVCDACGEAYGELVDFTSGAYETAYRPAKEALEPIRGEGSLKITGYDDGLTAIGVKTDYPIANHKYEITYTLKMDQWTDRKFMTFLKASSFTVTTAAGGTGSYTPASLSEVGWAYLNDKGTQKQIGTGYLGGASVYNGTGKYLSNDAYALMDASGNYTKDLKVVVDGFENTMALYAVNGIEETLVSTIAFTLAADEPNLRIGIFSYNAFVEGDNLEISNVTVYEERSVGGEVCVDHKQGSDKHTCDSCGEVVEDQVNFLGGNGGTVYDDNGTATDITKTADTITFSNKATGNRYVGIDYSADQYPIVGHQWEMRFWLSLSSDVSYHHQFYAVKSGETRYGWGIYGNDTTKIGFYNPARVETITTEAHDVDAENKRYFKIIIDGTTDEMTLWCLIGGEYKPVDTRSIPFTSDATLSPVLRSYGGLTESQTFSVGDVTITALCSDANKDHACDVCAEAVGPAHETDHGCTYCKSVGTQCEDNNSDHKCDECEAVITLCKDTDANHYCDACLAYVPSGITFDRITDMDPDGSGASYSYPDGYYQTAKKLPSLPRTYEAWVNIPRDVYGGSSVILSSWPDTRGSYLQNHFIFEIAGGVPRLTVYMNDERQAWIFSSSTVPADTWTHVAITYCYGTGGDQVACYINGALSSVSPTKITLGSADEFVNDRNLCLGGDQRTLNTNAFRGTLGNVAIYGDVRTAEEIALDATGVSDTRDVDLIAYYKLDEATAKQNIKDASGNGYDMTYGEVWVSEEKMEDLRSSDSTKYSYSIAFLPDTQYAVKNYPDAFVSIYDYLLENKDEKNIQYVISLGDMTDGSTTAEWDLVKRQTERLNGIIPYTVLRGNHDTALGIDATFADPEGYYYSYVKENGGFMDESSVVNTYHLFEVGKTKYVIVVLDYNPSDEVLAWADGILETYSDRRAIITTHHYLASNLSRGVPDDSTTANTGENIWNKMIRKHANVAMVVCGHWGNDQVLYRTDIGDSGNTVHQLLFDAQIAENNAYGFGMVAIMHFSEDGENISIEYYSTYREMYFREDNYITLSYDCYDGNGDHSCDYCGEELTHDVVEDDGDCTTDIVCSCGKVLESGADAHAPSAPVEENRTAPTCESVGGYDTVVYCAECGKEISRVHTEIDKLPSNYLVTNGEVEVAYATLAEAVAAAGEGGRVTLLASVTETALQLTVPQGLTLDGNGHTLTLMSTENGAALQIKGGDLTVTGLLILLFGDVDALFLVQRDASLLLDGCTAILGDHTDTLIADETGACLTLDRLLVLFGRERLILYSGVDVTVDVNTPRVKFAGASYHFFMQMPTNAPSDLTDDTYRGAQLYLGNDKEGSGIRFLARLSDATVLRLREAIASGASVTYGTLIAPADYVALAGAFTREALDALGIATAYVDIPAKNTLRDTDHDGVFEQFSGALVNLKSENYKRAFVAIPYVTVNGTVYYDAFSASDARSAFGIATLLLQNEDYVASLDETTLSILRAYAA